MSNSNKIRQISSIMILNEKTPQSNITKVGYSSVTNLQITTIGECLYFPCEL